jgi:transposase
VDKRSGKTCATGCWRTRDPRRGPFKAFGRKVVAGSSRAKVDAAAKRLMAVPGVLVSLAYTAVIDDPARFKRSSSVGAYLGLTPRRQQSGETDRMGRISTCGDGLLRATCSRRRPCCSPGTRNTAP